MDTLPNEDSSFEDNLLTHSIDAVYCYKRRSVVCLCVCVLATTTRPTKGG